MSFNIGAFIGPVVGVVASVLLTPAIGAPIGAVVTLATSKWTIGSSATASTSSASNTSGMSSITQVAATPTEVIGRGSTTRVSGYNPAANGAAGATYTTVNSAGAVVPYNPVSGDSGSSNVLTGSYVAGVPNYLLFGGVITAGVIGYMYFTGKL